jgi:hypothetical protein
MSSGPAALRDFKCRISQPISWWFVFLTDGVGDWFRKFITVCSVAIENSGFRSGFVVNISCKVSANKFTFSCCVTADLLFCWCTVTFLLRTEDRTENIQTILWYLLCTMPSRGWCWSISFWPTVCGFRANPHSNFLWSHEWTLISSYFYGWILWRKSFLRG